ncbi:MAG: class II aldolase/adducin family protein, partial [Malacoplasma sp.]
MFNDLKKIVFNANMFLKENNLVILTWGNVSLITPDRKYVIIKPSGVSYNDMKAEDMVVVDLEHNVVEGKLKPSSDTWTHINIYKGFPNINSIVHT